MPYGSEPYVDRLRVEETAEKNGEWITTDFRVWIFYKDFWHVFDWINDKSTFDVFEVVLA